MENEKVVVLQLKLTQKRCLFVLTLAFLCFHPRSLGSETLTLTTYYPAPYGGYVGLLTTNQTLLARDAGSVGIGLGSGGVPVQKFQVNSSGVNSFVVTAGGSVGVGTAGPAYKLTVTNGGIGGTYALTPNYMSWAAYGTGDGGAAIYNDASGFRKLMIVGNNSAGGNREVGIWDNLTVSNNLAIGGIITGVCQQVGYGVGGTTWCPNGNQRVFGWYAGGVGVCGMLFTGGVLQDPGRWTQGVCVTGDRTGTMNCCRIQ
ncbi:MAG: hypothetical protein NTX59_07830 [Elusimicrobia bacterium]|nr:hypothetical protein [Elusimicrobiota bacterium]